MFASTNEIRGTFLLQELMIQNINLLERQEHHKLKELQRTDRELDLKTLEIPYNDRDHALYIAFGPYKNPRYALSIVIEHGGSGSSTAAPIAKKLFKLIIDRHELREKTKTQTKWIRNINVAHIIHSIHKLLFFKN